MRKSPTSGTWTRRDVYTTGKSTRDTLKITLNWVRFHLSDVTVNIDVFIQQVMSD